MSSELTSPFDRYLDTNYVPSSEEVDGIAKVIQDQCKIAEDIRIQFEDMASKAKALQHQLERRAYFIKQHRALLSPFRRIPGDILGLIFLAARHNHGFPAIAISHVCRAWREMALNMPQLWAVISFNPKAYHMPQGVTESSLDSLPEENRKIFLKPWEEKWEKRDEAALTRLSAYIHRSGTRKLTIIIKADMPSQVPGMKHRHRLFRELVTTLRSTSSRWLSLEIEVSLREADSPLLILLKIPAKDMPALKSLTLCIRDELTFNAHTPSRPLAPFVESLRCPSLVALALPEFGPFLSREVLPFPFGDLLPFLASCKNLIHCSLELNDFRGSHHSGGTREIDLPRLQVLELSGPEPPTRGLAFRLNLPLLTQLSIMFSSSDPTDPQHSATVEWLSRFGGQLLDMTFDYLSLTQASLMHCLRQLTNVVRLKLVGNSNSYYHSIRSRQGNSTPSALIDDSILTELTPRLSQKASDEADTQGALATVEPGCLCPKLRKLECLMGPLEFNELSFLPLVFTRYGDGTVMVRGGVCRIEEVLLRYNRVLLDVSDCERWVNMHLRKEDGVEIDTRHLIFKISYLNRTM
ncbi:hypothetical protein NMY22_g5842 [Coprinellus aureogranulatus]|nr:hypothetical protein NMY22_g5842 [Coprinellus aureogranulatus]